MSKYQFFDVHIVSGILYFFDDSKIDYSQLNKNLWITMIFLKKLYTVWFYLVLICVNIIFY